MIVEINESKTLTKHNHANVNVNLTGENVTRIKSETMMNVDVSIKIQKNIMHVKKIIFRILLHVVVNMLNI